MKFSVSLFAMMSCALSLSALAKNPVIYGLDNRQEVYEASVLHQKLAASTATLINIKDITLATENSSGLKINQSTFKQWLDAAMAGQAESEEAESEEEVESRTSALIKSFNIPQEMKENITFCPDERFTEQPNPGWCSGFLIAPDLLVTAGHCTEIEKFCSDHRWVFDFKVDKKTGRAGEQVNASDVYSCKKIVSTVNNTVLGLDYAIVMLDRKVEGREPLELQTSARVEVGTELVVIGSPSGLPTKVADGSQVRSVDHSFFFLSNLDTYQGNSGSAVFNAQSGQVEGILVRGEDDFAPNTKLMCLESKRCKDGECQGESVTRITSVPELSFFNILHQASAAGDQATLERLLSLKLWVDIYGKNGVTALMRSAKNQSIPMMTMLLSKGADAQLADANANTALHYLAVTLSEKNADALKLLIDAGASLEVQNKLGNTPILSASKWSNLSAIKLLIAAGANKNAVNSAGETILTSFIKAGDTKAIEELMALGVDPAFLPEINVSAAN